MSCGKPHATDCREVLDKLYEYLDSEVTADDVHKIREHLDECAPCLREHDLEQVLKTLVRRSCQDRAPDGLRVKIMARITQVRVQYEG
jgi:mycothiol system anti-sigma-R factor